MPLPPNFIAEAFTNYREGSEPSPWFILKYACPCGAEWEDEDDHARNDKCAECARDTAPHDVEDVTHEPRADSQEYIRCASCGEHVNSSEWGAHTHPPFNRLDPQWMRRPPTFSLPDHAVAMLMATAETLLANVKYLAPEQFDDDEHEEAFNQGLEDAVHDIEAVRAALPPGPAYPELGDCDQPLLWLPVSSHNHKAFCSHNYRSGGIAEGNDRFSAMGNDVNGAPWCAPFSNYLNGNCGAPYTIVQVSRTFTQRELDIIGINVTRRLNRPVDALTHALTCMIPEHLEIITEEIAKFTDAQPTL